MKTTMCEIPWPFEIIQKKNKTYFQMPVPN